MVWSSYNPGWPWSQEFTKCHQKEVTRTRWDPSPATTKAASAFRVLHVSSSHIDVEGGGWSFDCQMHLRITVKSSSWWRAANTALIKQPRSQRHSQSPQWEWVMDSELEDKGTNELGLWVIPYKLQGVYYSPSSSHFDLRSFAVAFSLNSVHSPLWLT